MSSVTIQLAGQRTAYAPRERISGKVTWQCDKPPQSGEVRLVWSTRGRGMVDFGIAETFPLASPQTTETRDFTFTAPVGPYSFSGTLITLTWAIEVSLQPGNVSSGVEIVIAPDGKAVALPAVKSSLPGS